MNVGVLVVPAVAMLALSGCGSRLADDGHLGAQAESADEAGVPILVTGECDGAGSCGAGFRVDDVLYALSCGGVRAELVTEHLVARGSLFDERVEVRRIDGVDPDVLVAVSRDGGLCDEEDVVLSPWSMAFPEGSSDAAVRDAVCTAVVKEHRARNACS